MEQLKERKMFFAWGMDKEKAYLEDKAKQGYHLSHIGFGSYTFIKGEPKDMVYQFDFQMMSRKNEPDYLQLFEEWELVQRYGGWYYFRKERTEEQNEIYSNAESLRKMFLRLLGFLALVGFPLYYQILFVFPRMVEDGTLSTFYMIFRPVVYVFSALHAFALLRIFLLYRHLEYSIKQ